MTEITDEMVERAFDRLLKGEPGVLRQIIHVDSYPGEYSGDPDAYKKLPTSMNDMKQAIREMLEAAINDELEDLGVCPNCEAGDRISRVNAYRFKCSHCGCAWNLRRNPVMD